MLNTQYHKGRRCMHEVILCQEGYCSECIIYLNHASYKNPETKEQINSYQSKATRGELQLVTVHST
jgi:hypothetical protein